MRLYTWTLIVLHLILWAAVGYGMFQHAINLREIPFLKILGSIEKDLALPVYAQFVVTQALFLEKPYVATEILLPLYLPNEPLPIKILLYQNNKLVTWWKYPMGPFERYEGHKEAQLRFTSPILLEGKVEIRFDGSAIPHNLQDHAPRLFTETFDDAYPKGNYRIASNEKKGDISLAIVEQKTNYQIFTEDMKSNRLGNGIQILRWLSVLLLLACFPRIVVDQFFRNK
ncbi:MAG TPA: hypothetical protein VJI96_04625 [Candidatus Andersenbacteria bacterium]|nr:hypothetical protein [Candidatus Andersenbacteria bacterium]